MRWRRLKKIRKQGDTILLNEQASETNAEEMMANYDILHFAVRGQFNSDDPLRSGLLLTPGEDQDGILSLIEIFRLRFPGRAVVLSGCDTLPEKDRRGRAFPHCNRPFSMREAHSVVSTLWLVGDRAAAYLLELFIDSWKKKKTPRRFAPGGSAPTVREGYPPLVWAAFILTGKVLTKYTAVAPCDQRKEIHEYRKFTGDRGLRLHREQLHPSSAGSIRVPGRIINAAST